MLDECGVCGGDGIADGARDCDGTDQKPVTTATQQLADADSDGVCDNLKSLDVLTQLLVTTMRMLLTTTANFVPNSTSAACVVVGIADGACDCDGNDGSRLRLRW